MIKFHKKSSVRLRSLTLWLIAMLVTTATWASEVRFLDIDVRLRHNGSADITEKWDINVDDKISEWYLVQQNLGKIHIHDFSVRDEAGPYTDDSPWDIDRSRAEKAGKYGIVDKGGNNYELCWGVGSSGSHQYTVTYTMTNFVKQLNDSCAFNHMFVARNLSDIDQIHLRFSADSAMTRSNTRMWAFGHRQGNIHLNDSAGIVEEDIYNFTSSSAVIVMLAFAPGMFDPTNVVDEDFSAMKERALTGSEYGNGDTDDGPDWLESHLVDWFGESAGEKIYSVIIVIIGLVILLFLFAMAVPSCFGMLFYVLVIMPIWWLLKRLWWVVSLKPLRVYVKKRRLVGKTTWCRDIPADGNLNEAAKIKNSFKYGVGKKKYDNLIAAYIMRLINIGAISVITKVDPKTATPQQYFTFLPWDRKVLPERHTPNRAFDDKYILDLYDILVAAAGDDMVLQEKELKEYAKKHPSKVEKWYKEISGPYSVERANPQDVKNVFGLEKFLKDFTLVGERHAVEVQLWNEYLVYATLFGIADQVARDIQKICPEYFQLSKTAKIIMFDAPTHDFVGSMSSAMAWSVASAANTISRSSFTSAMSSAGSSWGGGGGSSWGGGGGFSGGGSGGGGR